VKSALASEASIIAKNLNFKFNVNFKRDQSVRGKVLSFVRNPVESLYASKDVLHVLNDVDFEAKPGDRIAVIGRNGAGKSTLCRLLSGVFEPSGGSLEIKGKVNSILDPAAAIFPDLTGRENAEIYLKLKHPELGMKLKTVMEEALDFSGLGAFLDVPVRNYSLGMNTRLCLSLAVAVESEILILDEVFDGADADFAQRISKRMLERVSHASIVIFVSHSLQQLQHICNRAILLHSGKIIVDADIKTAVQAYQIIPEGVLGNAFT